MLSVVCWLWRDPQDQYAHLFRYGPEYVNALRSMLERHLSLPHEVVCCTDDPMGIDPRVRIVELPTEVHAWPNYTKRLCLFCRDAGEIFGRRILQLDLDCVILRSIDHLVSRPEPFVGWESRYWGRRRGAPRYNGSIILMDAGCRPQVWETFDPETSPQLMIEAGLSSCLDQDWISYVLGPDEPVWPYGEEICSTACKDLEGAAIVFFTGRRSPAMPECQRQWPWIKEHWR